MAKGFTFFGHLGHVPWGEELALFDVQGLFCGAGGLQQVRLTTQKRGNLKDIHHTGDLGAVVWQMHIGDDGQIHFGFQRFQNRQALIQS